MTVAFKDLRKEMFFKAKEYFDKERFHCSFKVDKVYLLHHDSKKWLVDSSFSFK